MNKEDRPTLETFLHAPAEAVARVAPDTLIFAAGGTRRSAALAGIPLEQYAEWTVPKMLAACERIFRLGVRYLILPGAGPKIFAEQGLYRQQVLEWMAWGLAGEETLQLYRDHHWRVRLVVAGDPIPELADAVQKIEAATREMAGPLLLHLTTPSHDGLWTWYRQAFTNGASTREEAIEVLYGEKVPPASVLLSFGKPLVSLDVLPPLLYDDVQCYWTQQPSYDLDERALRTVLYDYAFLRPTWREDKTGRAERAREHRTAWEEGPTIGQGIRLGPFWYPAPITPPPSAPKRDDP